MGRLWSKQARFTRPLLDHFPIRLKFKVSANYQQEYSSVDAGLNKPPEKLGDVPNSPKNQMHPRGSGSRQIL